MRRFLVVMTAILIAMAAFAENQMPPRVVKVTGTSDVKVAPDRAVINIGVEKQNVSASAAKKAADAAARDVLAALRENHIDNKDIQTAFLYLQPQYDYKSGRIIYFVAAQDLTVTVRDLSKLDEVLESLTNAGGNRISGIQYETSELRKYRDEARDLAIRAAREKAEALAKGLGQSIGKAYSIEEVQQSNNPYMYGLMSNATVEKSGPSTAAGQKTVTASVTVSFELI